jgi:hypothetical protein
MIIGMSVPMFTLPHVLISLTGIVAGVVALGEMIAGRRLALWNTVFLVATASKKQKSATERHADIAESGSLKPSSRRARTRMISRPANDCPQRWAGGRGRQFQFVRHARAGVDIVKTRPNPSP